MKGRALHLAEARAGAVSQTGVWELRDGQLHSSEDSLATEEPLEIRIGLEGSGAPSPLVVTMRTPGADFELAAGFLFNEGVVASREDIRSVSYCTDRAAGEQQRYNIVNVALKASAGTVFSNLERHFITSSACGVCGKATLDSLHERGYERAPTGPALSLDRLGSLPAKLREAQPVFDTTGGLHAAAAFDEDGQLVVLREDVGRHNAMDKLAGWALLAGRMPLSGHVLVVSGRSSFELVQKSIRMGAGTLCSVSAPSSLAVSLAREFGLTLIGWLREGRFKVYSCPERVLIAGRADGGVRSPV